MPIQQSSRRALYELLRKGHRLTQSEAAERLGVSRRQVRRLLDRLEEEGVTIRSTWKDGEKEYVLAASEQAGEGPFASLSERQALALLVAAEAARPSLRPTPLARPLEEVGRRLAERMAPHVASFDAEIQPRRWHFDESSASVFAPEVFEALSKAIEAQRSVRIDYTTASTGVHHPARKIDPLLLAAVGGSWMAVAYCHKREELRDFALAGIEEIKPCNPDEEPAIFDPPKGFDPTMHFRDRFGSLSGDEVHVVRLLAEPKAARYFRRKMYHPTQQVHERDEDDRVVVSFEVEGLEEVRSFVRGWGAGVTVLAPEKLAAMIAEDARRVAERYADPSSSSSS